MHIVLKSHMTLKATITKDGQTIEVNNKIPLEQACMFEK